MLNKTVKDESWQTFERAVALFRAAPSSQAFFLVKDAMLSVQDTKNLPEDGYLADEHIGHRVGVVTVKVAKLEDLRDFIA